MDTADVRSAGVDRPYLSYKGCKFRGRSERKISIKRSHGTAVPLIPFCTIGATLGLRYS